ncbi:MAG: LysM peptidoglycan-binding domain-containing protein [Chloroflexi bacterium]|nr:LysM peptidoglycan-binding domain-containing protein [Chloroflexota bacterium]
MRRPLANAAKSWPPSTKRQKRQSGDSPSKIAKQLLGDAKRWPEIYEANKALIGDNPDLIHPGQKLRIP